MDYKLIQYQILKTSITRTEWQIVRRINSEILGVKGLRSGLNTQALFLCSSHFLRVLQKLFLL